MYRRTLIQSFKLALEGLKFVFKSERNMKIHCAVALIVLVLAILFKVSELELFFLIVAIAMVFITETANTAFELLLDFVHGDEFHPNVKLLKDIAAGGVFIASLSALVIGFIIFIPKVMHSL